MTELCAANRETVKGDLKVENQKYIDDVIFENLEVLDKMLSENIYLINVLEDKLSPFLFDLNDQTKGFPEEMDSDRPTKVVSYISQIIDRVGYNNKNIERVLERTRKQ